MWAAACLSTIWEEYTGSFVGMVRQASGCWVYDKVWQRIAEHARLGFPKLPVLIGPVLE